MRLGSCSVSMALAISARRAWMLGYPLSRGLPIIPRQRNPEEPAILGSLYYKEGAGHSPAKKPTYTSRNCLSGCAGAPQKENAIATTISRRVRKTVEPRGRLTRGMPGWLVNLPFIGLHLACVAAF